MTVEEVRALILNARPHGRVCLFADDLDGIAGDAVQDAGRRVGVAVIYGDKNGRQQETVARFATSEEADAFISAVAESVPEDVAVF